jgi:amino-acid N-acetyltransferase
VIANNQEYVNGFRHSAPYIHAHRGKTFVIYLPSEAMAHVEFANTVHDINLLNSMGVRLVLVHGSRVQIDQELQQRKIKSQFHAGLRITEIKQLMIIQAVVGCQVSQLEARFSMGLANSPMQGSRIRTVRGNYITARPIGVKNGIDYAYTGTVRRVDEVAIKAHLVQGNLVLMSCLGYSPTGETFNLAAGQVAGAVAAALQADKLIFFGPDDGLVNACGERVTELLTGAAHKLVRQYQEQSHGEKANLHMHLDVLAHAVDAGVSRGHLISYQINGALLSELFSRDGFGTMLIRESYEQIRCATIDDAASILVLIEPLEQNGVLVRRSRELLESEIHHFSVIQRDGAIIACAALYPFANEHQGELACLAVAADYRGSHCGERLLKHIEQQCQQLGLTSLFVLTTQTAHWFIEHGFINLPVADLPVERQSLYNLQRNSKVFFKPLR